ncbi:hypothetical protein [Oenococcus kitaharae]
MHVRIGSPVTRSAILSAYQQYEPPGLIPGTNSYWQVYSEKRSGDAELITTVDNIVFCCPEV